MPSRSLDKHPFAFDTAKKQYAADRCWVPQHVALKLKLDFKKRSLEGTAEHSLRPKRANALICFDAVDLQVDSVSAPGKTLSFEYDGRRLWVRFSKPVPAGQQVVVSIRYRTVPARGLYFIGPAGKTATQAWTQGQDEDARHWFPCLDAPAQKCSSELFATVPKHLTVLSNGTPVSEKFQGATKTCGFRLDQPHPPYLVSLVAGEFEEILDPGNGARIRTLFPQGRKADAMRCVQNTPQMMGMLQRWTGHPYPFGDYAQVFVKDFFFGGMENTAASTLTESVLHDAKAHLDYDAEYLIVHELAHQWFGDWVTCRDWAHGWLNEGFATYAEILWKEESLGTDEADHQRKLDLEAYLEEASHRYQRAVVTRAFDEPIEVFDHHLYEKGGLVVHALRRQLGDEAFKHVLQHYLAHHAGGAVETVDLVRAVERVTGRNLDGFFEQWIHRAGHPTVEVTLEYHPGDKRLQVSVQQSGVEQAFDLELLIWVFQGDKRSEHRLTLSHLKDTVFLPSAQMPTQAVVDPHRDLPAPLKITQPEVWTRAQLLRGPTARSRTEAAEALASHLSQETTSALIHCLRNEREFWGTRATAAASLGSVRSWPALEGLLRGLQLKHPKVRRAVAKALGQFVGNPSAGEALRRLLLKETASYFVTAEALRSLGQLRLDKSESVLAAFLSRNSFNDTVACAALDGLASTQSPAAWKWLERALSSDSQFVRRAAASGLAKLGRVQNRQEPAMQQLEPLLRDPIFQVRMAAIAALEALGHSPAAALLESTSFSDGRERRTSKEAIRALRQEAPLHAEVDALRREVEKLKATTADLNVQIKRHSSKNKKS